MGKSLSVAYTDKSELLYQIRSLIICVDKDENHLWRFPFERGVEYQFIVRECSHRLNIRQEQDPLCFLQWR
jgi:hypothetical protein